MKKSIIDKEPLFNEDIYRRLSLNREESINEALKKIQDDKKLLTSLKTHKKEIKLYSVSDVSDRFKYKEKGDNKIINYDHFSAEIILDGYELRTQFDDSYANEFVCEGGPWGSWHFTYKAPIILKNNIYLINFSDKNIHFKMKAEGCCTVDNRKKCVNALSYATYYFGHQEKTIKNYGEVKVSKLFPKLNGRALLVNLETEILKNLEI